MKREASCIVKGVGTGISMDHKAKDELYEPNPGEIDKCFCGICEEEMNVKRNNKPSGGFGGAMANHNRYYDRFWCKNRDEKWHRQVRALKNEIVKTPSSKIASMLTEEMNSVLANKKSTKEGGY